MSAVEKFPVLLSEAEEESSAVPPCFSDEGINVRSKVSTWCVTCPGFWVPLRSRTFPTGGGWEEEERNGEIILLFHFSQHRKIR